MAKTHATTPRRAFDPSRYVLSYSKPSKVLKGIIIISLGLSMFSLVYFKLRSDRLA
jgi:hypothetical protein